MDDSTDPTTPQPVKDAGAIDDATVQDRALEDGTEAPVLDPSQGVVYQPSADPRRIVGNGADRAAREV